MKHHLAVLFLLSSLAFSCTQPSPIELRAGALLVTLDSRGALSGLQDTRSGQDYLAQDSLSYLLSLRKEGKILYPLSAQRGAEEGILRFSFAGDQEARVRVEEKATHLALELLTLSRPEEVELVIWGPYPTLLSKQIGETVGVASGESFAIGIQSLNPKTLGGYPWQENDCMPQIDIFDQDDPGDLSEAGKRYVLYRVEAAKPAAFGSTLQAYCRNRNHLRVIQNWGYDQYLAPPFDDGGVLGTRIALFGCPSGKELETIGEIEIAEGLPHPMIDGQWGKTAPSASAAYVILEFGEADIDKALDVVAQAGLRYLYHPGPFKNWGHFELQEKPFPNGWQGLKRCVDKARQRGIYLGAHTLSNFITPNDPYVTPVPDPRLAKVGGSELREALSPDAKEIPIASAQFFDQLDQSTLRTVQIGGELIRVGRLEGQKLVDCQRGAWGTTAATHQAGDSVMLLADHAYKVFLSEAALSQEMGQTLADLYNQTGLRQISFDGLEGNRSTGMGNYGEVLFTQAWFEQLSPEIRSHYIADASRTSHFFWHMYSRMNWGEPWYAGFRESQTEYRMKNQQYFRRNFMPGMLGWFSYNASTSVEDIEWMLARSAAFNAGYAFFTTFEALEQNGNTATVLRLLGLWEKARMEGAFSEGQQKAMEDLSREFHLEAGPDSSLLLREIASFKFAHEQKTRQPGEPHFSEFTFDNPSSQSQPLQFLLTATEGGLAHLQWELDGYKTLNLALTLKEGETLKYSGGSHATLYSKTWRPLRTFPVAENEWQLSPGAHRLRFDCTFSQPEGQAKLEIRVVSYEMLNAE